MKKIIAVALTLALVFSLSTVAFAIDQTVSPNNPETTVNVTAITKKNTPGKVYVIKKGESLPLSADESAGEFYSWSVYLTDGKVAVPDVDYKFSTGNEKAKDIVIVANNDLIVCANFDGKITDPSTGMSKDSKSAKTGDALTLGLSLMALMSVAVVFGAKKQLSK